MLLIAASHYSSDYQRMRQPPSESTERLLHSIEEAAHLLGIGRSTTYALVRGGQLRSVRIGRRRLIPQEAVEEYAGALLKTGEGPVDDA